MLLSSSSISGVILLYFSINDINSLLYHKVISNNHNTQSSFFPAEQLYLAPPDKAAALIGPKMYRP